MASSPRPARATPKTFQTAFQVREQADRRSTSALFAGACAHVRGGRTFNELCKLCWIVWARFGTAALARDRGRNGPRALHYVMRSRTSGIAGARDEFGSPGHFG